MKILIEEIVQKLHSLPKVKILEVMDFVEFLTWSKKNVILQRLENDPNDLMGEDEFETIADHLADEFQLYRRSPVPLLSDYAVSRSGIYEEHP